MLNAIIMASGLGTRMRPLTDSVPKPHIKARGIPMIETVLNAMVSCGVNNIYIVIGYLGDQFSYLINKYPGIHIIKNDDYETVNNISSVYAAREVLSLGDCFICEADLFISNPSFLKEGTGSTCYFGRFVPGFSGDWVFETDSHGFISRVGKGGTDCYNMVGVSFFRSEDALMLKGAIEKRYGHGDYRDLFWDDVVNENLDRLKIRISPVKDGQITELDTVEELTEFNSSPRDAL